MGVFKLVVAMMFLTLTGVSAYSAIMNEKLHQLDDLVKRGIDPTDALNKVYK